MSHIARITFTLALFLPNISFSETKETEELGRITEQYGRCVDVVSGNFDSKKKSQDAGSRFFRAMIQNISSMIEIERKQGHESTVLFLNMVGKEVFTGYLLRGFSEVSETYQKEKNSLLEANNWDWKRTDQQLWRKYGCDAVYKGLPK